MGKSQKDLYSWSLKKAEEYLESANSNMQNSRLYHYGVRKIEYPGKKKFTGRLALQFLIRDTLFQTGRIDRKTYDKYLELAADLHKAGYTQGASFQKKSLKEALAFAEDLFYKVKALK